MFNLSPEAQILDYTDLFPGIKWKLLNIRKMAVRKKKESYSRLKKVLEIP